MSQGSPVAALVVPACWLVLQDRSLLGSATACPCAGLVDPYLCPANSSHCIACAEAPTVALTAEAAGLPGTGLLSTIAIVACCCQILGREGHTCGRACASSRATLPSRSQRSVQLARPNVTAFQRVPAVLSCRWATFIGLAIMAMSAPASGIFVGKIIALRRGMLKYTDNRVKLMNQLLAGIRVLKIYAWEAACGEFTLQGW